MTLPRVTRAVPLDAVRGVADGTAKGLPAYGHDIGDQFASDRCGWRSRRPTTPGRTTSPGASDRIFEPEDCCGFWIDTPDGTIWAPGDSRLIPDHHLRMPTPDAMLFDFSDSEWHFGLDGAIEMANAYPTLRCCCTTGAVWTPPISHRSMPTQLIAGPVGNPERIQLLAPGEPFVLSESPDVVDQRGSTAGVVAGRDGGCGSR